MLILTLTVSWLTTSNLPWFVGPNIPGSYAIFFTTLDFTFTTRHIHNWVLFPLWLRLFITSGTISLLFSSSILVTCQCGEFIFQCHIFFPFHTVLRTRMLKWFAFPFSSGPHFVRALHPYPCVLGGPVHGSYFHWVRQDCDPCDQFG